MLTSRLVLTPLRTYYSRLQKQRLFACTFESKAVTYRSSVLARKTKFLSIKIAQEDNQLAHFLLNQGSEDNIVVGFTS